MNAPIQSTSFQVSLTLDSVPGGLLKSSLRVLFLDRFCLVALLKHLRLCSPKHLTRLPRRQSGGSDLRLAHFTGSAGSDQN